LKGYRTILDLGVERIQSADRVTIFHERERWDFAWDYEQKALASAISSDFEVGTIPKMRIPFWIKIGWTLWLGVWMPFYWIQYGPQNFLYFCDIANLLIGLALWLESPLLFSWQATSVLLFQTLYTIDLVGRLTAGKHLIGGTEYMFSPAIPLFVRLLGLFHVVTPPVLLWGIWRLGYDRRGWIYAIVTAWIVLPICFLWRPGFNVICVRGPFFKEQHVVTPVFYLAA
jgi:hypothetical protein